MYKGWGGGTMNFDSQDIHLEKSIPKQIRFY